MAVKDNEAQEPELSAGSEQDTNEQGSVSSPTEAEIEEQLEAQRQAAIQDLLNSDDEDEDDAPEDSTEAEEETEDEEPDEDSEEEEETEAEEDDDEEEDSDDADASLSENEEDDTEDAAEDDGELDEEEARKSLGRRGRKNFDKILKERRELRDEVTNLRGDAQYGRAVKDFVDNNGWSDRDLESWLTRGNDLRKAEPQKQAEMLVQWATDLGYQPPVQAAPDLSSVRKRIAQLGDEFELMTPETAKQLLKELSTAAPAEPEAQQPPQQPPQQRSGFTAPGTSEQQSTPTNGVSAAEEQAGRNALAQAMDTARSKVGEKSWDTVHKKALAKVQKYKGVHPSNWAAIYTDIVEGEIAKVQARKPQKKPGKSLRGGGPDRPPAKPREEGEYNREDAIRDLTGG